MKRIVNLGLAAAMLAAGPLAAARPKPVPHKQIGTASVYSSKLQGRTMTNGEPFNVSSNAAASRTLPLGTKARVTNLKNGKSAEVTVKDHGPVPKSRVMDLTPHTAREIGLTKKDGLAKVAIVPTSVPAGSAQTAAVTSRH